MMKPGSNYKMSKSAKIALAFSASRFDAERYGKLRNCLIQADLGALISPKSRREASAAPKEENK